MKDKNKRNDSVISVPEEDPKVSCFDCFAETPAFKAMTAQHSMRKCRLKFLTYCPFKKRLRMEFILSRNALAKFMKSRGVQPIVTLPDLDKNIRRSFTVWEIVRTMSQWRNSMSSYMYDKKVPIIEEPIHRIKEFPLTQVSVKKHVEKEAAKKKEEKQSTVLMLKKKQQELKRLKEELELQTEKQYCHYNERMEDYEKEKMKYLQKLANDHNFKLKDLVRNGDIIYKNYRSEMKKANERKMKELEMQAEVNARLLKEEVNKQRQLKRQKTPWVPKFTRKKVVQRPSEQVEEEEVVGETGSIIELKENNYRRMGPDLKPHESSAKIKRIRLASSNSVFGSVHKMNKWTKRRKTLVESKKDQELNVMIKKLEMIWKEIDQTWSEETKEPLLPDNVLLIVKPTSLEYKDFLPYDDYKETVNMYNPTKESIDCGFFKAYTQPEFEEPMFEVYPELIMRIRPGGNQNFQVVFTTDHWDEVKDGIEGTVWFFTKLLKTNNFYRIPISVHCTRFTSNIRVDNPIIEFDQVPSWVNDSSTKYLDISNYSKIDYEVYIRRKTEKDGEESHELDTEPSKLDPIDQTVAQVSLISTKPASPDNFKQDSLHHGVEYTKPHSDQLEHSKHNAVHRSPEHVELRQSKNRQAMLKKVMREESTTVARELLESMIEEVYQPFKIHLTRGVLIDRETKISIPIEFSPSLAGNAERVVAQIIVSYEGRFLTRNQEVVTLIANMYELPISISPAMLDMQVTMIETGVWQTSFEVSNTSKKFVKVKIVIPQNLSKHFIARPTSFVVRPNEKESVLVRARIGWSIYEDSGSLLDRTLSLLEFPISIQADSLPEQTLGTLAVISDPLALTIEPASLNLGFVNTFETIVADFWLKNNTVAPLNFGFINVPPCCLIMPQYGFSTIGPAQKIKLQFLYSPGVREAGKAGGLAIHMFSVACTTMERLSSEKPPCDKYYPDEEILRNTKGMFFETDDDHKTTLYDLLKLPMDGFMTEAACLSSKNMESLSFLNENLNNMTFLERKEVISPVDLYKLKKTVTSEIFYSADTFRSVLDTGTSKDYGGSSSDLTHIPELKSLAFVSLNCMAIVTDPICEFSAQELFLPDTPYGSFSINSIYLRCPSDVSGINCHCGKFRGLRDDPKNWEVRFEFFHQGGKDLDVQPATGSLSFGENVKIYITLQPDLIILESPKEVKVKRTKPASKTSSKAEMKTLMKPVESRFSARSKLHKVKNMSNTNFYARVRCLISVKEPDSPDLSYDNLFCDIFSTFTRPDIFVVTPNSKREVIFPKTAIGTKRLETIEVHNTANELVYVTRSHFSPREVFLCHPLPPSPWILKDYKGVPLEPEEFLKLTITFCPLDEAYAEEYFELRGNKTICPLKVSGLGVSPRFSLNSQFSICRMEAMLGNKVEDIITISNKSEAELQFEIIRCFQMETTSSEVFKVLRDKYSTKNIYKDMYVDKSIVEDIHEKFINSEQPSPFNIEPQQIRIQPSKKGTIRISFSPKKIPVPSSTIAKIENSEWSLIDQETEAGHRHENYHKVSHNNHNNSPRHQNTSFLHQRHKLEECPTFYVEKVQLVLGRITLAAEWILIGKVVKDNKKRT